MKWMVQLILLKYKCKFQFKYIKIFYDNFKYYPKFQINMISIILLLIISKRKIL